MVMSPAEPRPANDYAGEDQQQLKVTDPTSRNRGRPHINTPATDSNKDVVLDPTWGLDIKTLTLGCGQVS
jgi:hypothetical protein